MKRYTLEDHKAYRRQEDEKAAKEADERRERTEKKSARRAWLADGGSDKDFELEWPKLRDEGRRRRVVVPTAGPSRRSATAESAGFEGGLSMVHISNHGALFDGASASLRGVLGELEGVSPETLAQLDFISQPRTDCPPPQDDERHAVYNRLVLLALAENALEKQRAGVTKAKKAG
jgi:hypothetical protein